MSKSFTLQNMQTYFQNYIPCTIHLQEPITNFCLQSSCLRPLCPECVEQHSRNFESHRVQSIKSCISRSSSKLSQVIKILNSQKTAPTQSFRTPQQYSTQYIHSLRSLKQQIHNELNKLFQAYEQKIKSQIRMKWSNVDNLREANIKLTQAIRELQILYQKLFMTSTTLETNKKVNQIDFQNLILHFKTQIQQANTRVDLDIQIDPNISEKISRTIAELIEIKPKKQQHIVINEFQKIQSMTNLSQNKVVEYDSSRKIKPLGASMYPDKVSPAKDKKIMEIYAENSFVNEPFLHFFQTGSRNLHILMLDRINSDRVKWQIVRLNILFNIPTFHKSIFLRNGAIFLTGGSLENEKLNKIFQYANQDLIEVGNLLCPRSSHCIAAIGSKIFIVGGFTTGNIVTEKCEVYDTSIAKISKIADVRKPCSSSSLVPINNHFLLKIGGTLSDGANCRVIERYDTQKNIWQLIDPVFENFQGEFQLLSTSASIQINTHQVFIFGGYNQQNNNEVSDLSYIIDFQGEQYSLKDINRRPLPIAEGFWNHTPVIYNNKIFALQNVADDTSDNCMQNKRNVIIFDGKSWVILN